MARETKIKPQPFTIRYRYELYSRPSTEVDRLLERITRSAPAVTDPDQPLQIDSLGLIRLVAFLESDLNVRVEDEELLAENFATARSIAMLINPKMEHISPSGVPNAPSSGQ